MRTYIPKKHKNPSQLLIVILFIINHTIAIMHKSNVPMVHNIAPPSYAEAMGQSVSTTNIPTSTQSTTYPQDSQSYSYPSSATPYPNNSYSPYPYVSQQNQPTSTPYVINATMVQPINENSVTGCNNNKRGLWVMFGFVIWFAVIISVFINIFR